VLVSGVRSPPSVPDIVEVGERFLESASRRRGGITATRSSLVTDEDKRRLAQPEG